MSNYEEAVLVGGPKDGEKVVVNRDYGDYVTVVMPSKTYHPIDGQGRRYQYDRTKEVRDGRQVYLNRSAEGEG